MSPVAPGPTSTADAHLSTPSAPVAPEWATRSLIAELDHQQAVVAQVAGLLRLMADELGALTNRLAGAPLVVPTTDSRLDEERLQANLTAADLLECVEAALAELSSTQ